jgi:uncharacterized repeat protein (TIGR03806 family)
VGGLAGRYLFADWATGRIWALRSSGGGYLADQLVDAPFNIPAFSQGNDGEVYILAGNGLIYRFAGSGGVIDDNVPDNLVDTGCVSTANPTQPASGLVPYEPAAAFWSDNAVKTRWVGLPNGTTIDVEPNDDWSFPSGTVLMKNFELGGTLIETRLFMRHPDGGWAGYTYAWNSAETQATRVRGGGTRTVGSQTWIYPSEGECLACHTDAAGFALGLETAQLNSQFRYVSTGITDNQLEVFNHIGMFSADIPEPVSSSPALADPFDTSRPLSDRARAYLHTNCAQCHQPGGPGRGDMDLRYSTALSLTGACDTLPQFGDLGLLDARIVAPGSAERSVLIERVGRRDANGMPPLASTIVDSEGVALLSEWADSLTSCAP